MTQADGDAADLAPSPRLLATARRRGPVGQRWLAELPDLAIDVCAEWGLQLKGPLDGGSEALVLDVRTERDEPAVLKLAVPGPAADAELHRLVAGPATGLVEVLRADPRRHVVLLERLGPTLASSGLSLHEQLEILAAALRDVWAFTPDLDEHSGADAKALSLARLCHDLQRELDDPCPPEAFAAALGALDRRMDVPAHRMALLHGDPHPGNLLRRPTGGWAFIDPDGFVGDTAYDLGVAMRSWCAELTASADPVATAAHWAHRLGSAASVDPVAVWDWALAERVSTGLYLLALGDREQGRAHLDSAAAIARGRPAQRAPS